MFPSRNRLSTGLRLTSIAVAATLAGCSGSPFADDNPAPRTPVARTVQNSGASRSAPTRPQAAYSAPAAQLISKPVPLASGHPDEYIVQAGDTLWDIAATFLKDPWYWPEVWYVNPQVENPHLIYPGDVLALVTIDGEQRITNIRAATYRLSPQARITPIDESITSIPYETISAFLSRGLVLEKSQIEELPYVLAIRDGHMMAAAGNDVYVRGGAAAATGTQYNIVHIGDELIDPDDGKTVGYQGIYIGKGALTRGGDPATVSLTSSNRETLRGDRLVPDNIDIPLSFFPKTPDYDINGSIISVVDGVSLIGQYQVVVINRGSSDGLAPGDVLTVLQKGEVISDPYASGWSLGSSLSGGERVKLPEEEAGIVMMFKVYDRIGYGLVMEAHSDIHVLDTVRSPN